MTFHGRNDLIYRTLISDNDDDDDRVIIIHHYKYNIIQLLPAVAFATHTHSVNIYVSVLVGRDFILFLFFLVVVFKK